MLRLLDHVAAYTDVPHAYEVVADVREEQSFDRLAHPRAGRPTQRRGVRSLVVSVRGQTYRCFYRLVDETVIVLCVRDTRLREG